MILFRVVIRIFRTSILYPDGLFLYFWDQLSCACCVVLYFICFIRCLVVSLHLSIGVYQVFNRLDFAGINILISGSCFPPLYYAFYCSFDIAVFYLKLICTGGCILFVVSFFPWLHRVENTKIKAFLFGGFGASFAIPLAHLTIN